MAVDVKAYGPESTACKAITAVLTKARTIQEKAFTGSVEQADIDAAFGPDVVSALPADAVAYVAALHSVAVRYPGKDVVATSTYFGQWAPAFEAVEKAAAGICS